MSIASLRVDRAAGWWFPPSLSCTLFHSSSAGLLRKAVSRSAGALTYSPVLCTTELLMVCTLECAADGVRNKLLMVCTLECAAAGVRNNY